MNHKTTTAVSAAILLALAPSDAHAMHIGEGILPFGWAALWYAAALPFIALGLMKLNKTSHGGHGVKPLIGMTGAAVFVISCMPIPVPFVGTCSHPAGTAMAAILIGPLYSVLAAAAALLLQALFLSHGGLSTWGANLFSMGVAGSFAGYLAFKGLTRLKAPLFVAAFFAGLIGDWATYAVTSFELAAALSGPGEFSRLFYTIIAAFSPAQIPLGVLEGLVTAGAVRFLYSRRPEIIDGVPGGCNPDTAGEAGA